jgi:murein DD-endopeptidase MepM/ murein hydrolase activator NlpD
MDIKLSPELTSLRASPDPRKDAEARELSDILAARRPGADSIDGPFVRPLRELAVSATFADTRRYLYSNGQSAESLHYGIDLYQEAGCPVAASGGGRVVLAKARIVTGNTVVIEHAEGLYSLYYHLERIDVAVGDLLHAGSPLGSVGSTGLATGPHLHWELRLYGEAVDPESLVGNALLEGMRVR